VQELNWLKNLEIWCDFCHTCAFLHKNGNFVISFFLTFVNFSYKMTVLSLMMLKCLSFSTFCYSDGAVAASNSAGHRRTRCVPATVSLHIRRGSVVALCHTGSANPVTGAFVWCGAAQSAADITATTCHHSCPTRVHCTQR